MGETKGAGNANSWYPAAISTGGNILNTFVEQMFAEHNREHNFYYNEKAADNADNRKRAWYQDFETPAAMVRQLKEAGLSPSMMYGDMGGSSGVSAPQGAGVGGGAYPSGKILDPLTIANIANINADTKKKDAERDNLEQDTANKGQEYELIGAQINNVLKDTEYKQIGIKAMEISNELQSLALKIEQYKWDEGFTHEMIDSEARKLYNESFLSEEQWKLAENNRKLAQETFDTNVNIVSAQYSNLMQDLLVKSSQISLNEQQCTKLINDMSIDWFNAKVYNLSEEAKVIHMKNQIQLEFRKLGVNADLTTNQQTLNGLSTILNAISNLVGMTMIANGGIKLQK